MPRFHPAAPSSFVRVLFVCKSLPLSFKGGIQTHVWELTHHLMALGCKVTILTGGNWRSGLRTEICEGRTLIYLPYVPGRRLPVLQKTIEDLAFNVSAFRWLRRHASAYDQVHVQGRSGCLYAAYHRSPSLPPVITTFHRLLSVEYQYDGQRTGRVDGWLHRRVMSWAERGAAQHSDRIVAVSREMERELIEAYGEALAPITILPNGVSEAFGERVVDGAERWQLVFVGRLERIKGVYTLLEAMTVVDPRISLVIVGDGPERRGLESFTRRHDLRRRVRFLGEQDADAVRYWIQRSYALVLPSYHESQGIVLLEAGICARPVLGASAPGIDEVVIHGQTGLLYPVGDARSLAVVTDHLFKDPALANRLGKEGRRRAKEVYDWEHIAANTLALYASLAAIGTPLARVIETLAPAQSSEARLTLPGPALEDAVEEPPLEMPLPTRLAS